MTKATLYEFAGSCWANVPKIAMSETGLTKDDVKWVSINLAEGANFDPEFLKKNPKGTLPTLELDGETYTDSTTVVSALLKIAPHPPKTGANTSTSIIEEVHAEAHDPNATLLTPISEEDRDQKKAGLPQGFLAGRQKALDKFAPDAPSDVKTFLTNKQKGNKEFLEFFTGSPDEATKQKIYSQGKELWKSAGIVIRGPITQAIKKSGGPFVGGSEPSEGDYHVITWLARTVTNTGVEPGSPSSVAIKKLQEYTGGHEFDPVIAKYWDAWIARPSFKENGIH